MLLVAIVLLHFLSHRLSYLLSCFVICALGGLCGRCERDDHDIVRCDRYAAGGVPGSAEVMMECHAHPDRHEISGLLAGSWSPDCRWRMNHVT